MMASNALESMLDYCEKKAAQTVAFLKKPEQLRLWQFFFALLTTAIFYWPRLWTEDPGLGYAADDLHNLYAPQIIKVSQLFHQGIFQGIDVSTLGGAAEFFLRPNIVTYHPLIILYSQFHAIANIGEAVAVYTGLFFLTSVVACYFTQRLMSEFFDLGIEAALVAGLLFSFSSYWCELLHLTPFLLIAGWLPAVLYSGLLAYRQKSLKGMLLLALPVYMTLVGGYIPISIGVLFFSALFIVLCIPFVWREKKPITGIFYGLSPLLAGALLALPYYLAIQQYHKDTAGYAIHESVKMAAHDYSVAPQLLLQALSSGIVLNGSVDKYFVFLGLVPLAILVLFFARRRPPLFAASEKGRLFLLAFSLFFVAATIIYGTSSVLSDLFYYFAPLVGAMHLYHRYLLLFQIFFALCVGLGLQTVIDAPDTSLRRPITLSLMFAALAAVVFLSLSPDGVINLTFGGHPSPNRVTILGWFVVDCLLALTPFAIWSITESRRAFASACAVMIFISSVYPMYNLFNESQLRREETKALTVESTPEGMKRMADYFKAHSDKELVRVVNLVPDFGRPAVGRNIGWFMLPYADISDYFGYELHLSTQLPYPWFFTYKVDKTTGVAHMVPNWDWVMRSGGTFAIFQTSRLATDPELAKHVRMDEKDILTIKPGVVIAPIVPESGPAPVAPVAYDNGYVRLLSSSPAKVDNFKTNKAGDLAFTYTLADKGFFQYSLWLTRHLTFMLDGKKVVPNYGDDKIARFAIPAGTHSLAVTYFHPLLAAFLLVSTLYFAALGISLLRGLRRWH